MELARGSKRNPLIRVKASDDDDSDSDEDPVFGRSADAEDDRDEQGEEQEDLRKSFGKRGGQGRLAELKAKLSLSEELGAMKSELNAFDADR